MERGKAWKWVRRVGIGLLIVLFVTGAAIGWRTVSLVESELLTPGRLVPAPEAEIVSVAGSRVVLADNDAARADGVWGVRGPDGYAQMTRVIGGTADGVERGFAVVEGFFTAGDVVSIEANAFVSDPRAAHGLPFEEVRVPGELGVNPAWLITGELDTWVVFVHGKEASGREQALRSLPTFRKLGFPVLVITYRNDASGGAGDATSYTWGLDEWRDLDAALGTATLRGAEDFVLVGHDMGASIISNFLHLSDASSDVRAVVFDSAVLDLEALVDDLVDEKGIPGFLANMGKAVARIRFGLEWSRLDQLERVGEFDPELPMLLLHGSADEVMSIDDAAAFAAALPNARLERFESALHGALWNLESVRYDQVLADFLLSATPELQLEE
jgi:pimeloyl-ACP methyl ester carboxylesterase